MDHVVGALQAQGLMPVLNRGDQPTTQCTHLPNQVMRRGFATFSTAEQAYMQQVAGGVIPPFFPPTWPEWPYNAVHGQGFVGSDPTAISLPIQQAGPTPAYKSMLWFTEVTPQ